MIRMRNICIFTRTFLFWTWGIFISHRCSSRTSICFLLYAFLLEIHSLSSVCLQATPLHYSALAMLIHLFSLPLCNYQLLLPLFQICSLSPLCHSPILLSPFLFTKASPHLVLIHCCFFHHYTLFYIFCHFDLIWFFPFIRLKPF